MIQQFQTANGPCLFQQVVPVDRIVAWPLTACHIISSRSPAANSQAGHTVRLLLQHILSWRLAGLPVAKNFSRSLSGVSAKCSAMTRQYSSSTTRAFIRHQKRRLGFEKAPGNVIDLDEAGPSLVGHERRRAEKLPWSFHCHWTACNAMLTAI